jgi:hypothetical protein
VQLVTPVINTDTVQALQAILEQAQSGDDIAAALMAIIG